MSIRVFEGQHAVRKAISHSYCGGQALHVWQPVSTTEAPKCFKKYKVWAHLFDQNLTRLIMIGKALGINNIAVERQGQVGQHIDLCGKPLEKALDMAEKA